MTCAYDKIYLEDAMRNLGEAMDFAKNICHLEMDVFFEMFIKSGIADLFGQGMPKYVSGLSGSELVLEVLQKYGTIPENIQAQLEYDYSPEYWCGWSLAYFQWITGLSFGCIHDCLSMKEIETLYPVLHEASEDKFVDTFNAIIRKKTLPVHA